MAKKSPIKNLSIDNFNFTAQDMGKLLSSKLDLSTHAKQYHKQLSDFKTATDKAFKEGISKETADKYPEWVINTAEAMLASVAAEGGIWFKVLKDYQDKGVEINQKELETEMSRHNKNMEQVRAKLSNIMSPFFGNNWKGRMHEAMHALIMGAEYFLDYRPDHEPDIKVGDIFRISPDRTKRMDIQFKTVGGKIKLLMSPSTVAEVSAELAVEQQQLIAKNEEMLHKHITTAADPKTGDIGKFLTNNYIKSINNTFSHLDGRSNINKALKSITKNTTDTQLKTIIEDITAVPVTTQINSLARRPNLKNTILENFATITAADYLLIAPISGNYLLNIAFSTSTRDFVENTEKFFSEPYINIGTKPIPISTLSQNGGKQYMRVLKKKYSGTKTKKPGFIYNDVYIKLEKSSLSEINTNLSPTNDSTFSIHYPIMYGQFGNFFKGALGYRVDEWETYRASLKNPSNPFVTVQKTVYSQMQKFVKKGEWL